MATALPMRPTLKASSVPPIELEYGDVLARGDRRGARIGKTNYAELWDRLYLWTVDGKFGSRTLAALRSYQQRHRRFGR